MNNSIQQQIYNKLSNSTIENLKNLSYNSFTPIQEKTLLITLEGKDLIAKAKTGSGKTAAFGIPIIEKLDIKYFRIQAIVLCPTRELANQVANELRNLAKSKHNIKITLLCGGVPYKPQVHSLSHQAHIVVGTPGRILKHLQEGNFSTKDIDTFVLDEADRMLDMGFIEDIKSIIEFLPKNRQNMLFSATYPIKIESLTQEFMNSPYIVEAQSLHSQSTINQYFYQVNSSEEKNYLILKTLQEYKPISTIIFCNTKLACKALSSELDSFGLEALELHSDYDQKERNEVLALFSNKSYPLLIATDVASRGLDIDDVELVINYDLPQDIENYIHRIGRTARAGKSGVAISCVENIELFKDIVAFSNSDSKLLDITIEPLDKKFELNSPYKSIFINGGKKQKLNKGDIVGALMASKQISKDDIGKIITYDFSSYVAVKNEVSHIALELLNNQKIKAKYYKAFLK
ncbi:MAG: ATP-dependent RNA helicase DbpA [Arcobacteraceae bacterium]